MNRQILLLVFAVLLAAQPLHAQLFDECTNPRRIDYEDIVEACTERLENDPQDADAYYGRAYAYVELGNYEAAIDDFNEVLAMRPKSADAYLLRGFAYAGLGEVETAIADYSRAVHLDPSAPLPVVYRAYAYLGLGDYDNALADADLLAEIDPASSDVHDIRGRVYLAQEAYEDAVDAYNAYIELAPNDPSGYLSRGYAYWQMDEDARAAPDYLIWVEANTPRFTILNPKEALEPITITIEEGFRFTLTLEAASGDTLTASAIAEVATVDPVLILLNDSGDPITVDDDGAGGIGGADAIIEDFEFPEDGTYTLVIAYAGGGSEGDVRLDVRLNRVR